MPVKTSIETKKQFYMVVINTYCLVLTEQYLSNKDFNILSIDLPGHGKSDGPCLTSIEKIADWLKKLEMK